MTWEMIWQLAYSYALTDKLRILCRIRSSTTQSHASSVLPIWINVKIIYVHISIYLYVPKYVYSYCSKASVIDQAFFLLVRRRVSPLFFLIYALIDKSFLLSSNLLGLHSRNRRLIMVIANSFDGLKKRVFSLK